MSEAFGVSFDPQSISEMARYYGFSNLLSPEVQQAMDKASKILEQAGKENTWRVFEHPSGELASTIHRVSQSPYEVIIGSDDPKARRRELGFSGRTDRLGRYFPSDPPKPYLAPAMDDNQQEVLALIEEAFEQAMQKVGAK